MGLRRVVIVLAALTSKNGHAIFPATGTYWWVLVGTGRYTVLAKHHGGSPVMFHSEIVIFHISIVIFHISGGVG